MHALHIEEAVIGIENNKRDAIQTLKKASQVDRYRSLKMAALQVKYPQGSEKQLIKAILDREVPSGGLPIEVGVIVHNVGYRLCDLPGCATTTGRLIERVVTVTGKNLENPSNFWVRIGTPVKDLIEEQRRCPGKHPEK